MRKAILAGLLTAVAMGAVAQAPAVAQESQDTCFYPTQWDGGWKAPNDHTVYIRVSGGRVFRLDMTNACPGLNFSSSHLINRYVTGSVCKATDWNLKVTQDGLPVASCTVASMTLLTPAQIGALPRSALP